MTVQPTPGLMPVVTEDAVAVFLRESRYEGKDNGSYLHGERAVQAIFAAAAPLPTAASELDAFSTWFDQIAEQNIATLDNEGRATEGWDMAEVVAQFRANRAEIQ